MLESRKCIGVITAEPDGKCQQMLLQGIRDKAFEKNMNVAVFCTATTNSCYSDYSKTEEQIFYLPDFDKLYGVVYAPDMINFSCVSKITERCLKASCPVVCTEVETEGFISLVGTDDGVVREMILHLYHEHGCRDIAYMTGIKDHPHAEMRLQSYRNIMQELGINVTEDRVFYGDFWYDKGEDFVQQLLDSEKGLPQAIACASDRMAHSVCEALKSRGYSVPGDILVTGYYENDPNLSYITGMGKNPATVGYRAVEMICDIVEGKQYEKKAYYVECASSKNISYSCGCVDKSSKMIMGAVLDIFEESGGFFSPYNRMAENLQEVDGFNDFFWKMDWYTSFVKPFEHMSVCLCEGWDKSKDNSEYTENMHLIYENYKKEYEDDYARSVDFERTFPRSEMSPALWLETKTPVIFYFFPVFTNKRSYGYIVLSYGNGYIIDGIVHKFWLRDFQLALESQRKFMEIKFLYSAMEKNAVIDSMTSLYNRNGFNMYSQELLDEATVNKRKFAVIMADLNCLKYINDVFGHYAGDDAICTAGKAISYSTCPKALKERNFRMGGDEYLKIVIGDISSEDVEECISEVNKYLAKRNNRSDVKYPVIVSMGYAIDDADKIDSLNEFIITADERMIKNKIEVKKKTGFDHKRNEK